MKIKDTNHRTIAKQRERTQVVVYKSKDSMAWKETEPLDKKMW